MVMMRTGGVNMSTILIRGLLRIGTGVVVAGIAVFWLAPIAGATTYDTDADFSTSSNPRGAWSWGQESTLGGLFTLFTKTACGQAAGIDTWCGSSGFPHDDHNSSGAEVIGCGGNCNVPAGGTIFHPGPNGEYALFRFTAPSAGSYSINATFDRGDFQFPTTTDVHVLYNNTSVFDSSLDSTNASRSFSDTRTFALFDTVDFAVGYGGDNSYFGDTTRIHGTLEQISTVPEPSTLPLVASGLAGLCCVRGRRRR
jgi:hypothetical protein